VATWHPGGHPAFIFVHTCHFDGQLASWWAPGISFGGHLAFIMLSTWHYGSRLASLCAPSISFGGHMVFWWPRGILMVTQRLFLCPTVLLVGTQGFFSWCPPKCESGVFHQVATHHLDKHPAFISVGTQHIGGHATFSWPPRIFMGTQCFFSWAPGSLGATWNVGGHSAIVLVGTWRLVTTWHLVGHPAFLLLGT